MTELWWNDGGKELSALRRGGLGGEDDGGRGGFVW